MADNPNDRMSAHVLDAGVWGDPSQPLDDPGALGATIEQTTFDYSGGVLVGPGQDEVATAPPISGLFRERTDNPLSYEAPHEATHRRYEPPIIIPIAQAAAGYLKLLAPFALHFVKIIAANITLDAAGTLKFVQGPADGTGVSAASSPADLCGAMAMGGAATPPLNLPPAETATPWLFTSSDQALGLFTVTGKAGGWIMVVQAPYES